MNKTKNKIPARNDVLLDIWSVTHFFVGVTFGWLMSPLAAIIIMVLWEPLEILVLSPLLRRMNIIFGHETLRNSLSDIFFDILGVLIGLFVLSALVTPPFHLL
ncbi:hypothetical protein BH10PAT3_BH10PAT3_1300 [soil metagenome]